MKYKGAVEVAHLGINPVGPKLISSVSATERPRSALREIGKTIESLHSELLQLVSNLSFSFNVENPLPMALQTTLWTRC